MSVWSSGRRKGRKEIEKKLREEEREEERKRLNWLKQRRLELRRKLSEITKKETHLGLTQKEQLQKRAYDEELVKIEDELLENKEFLRELEQRADLALLEAKKGAPSAEIKKGLIKEGYTEKEIQIIRKFFDQKKASEGSKVGLCRKA